MKFLTAVPPSLPPTATRSLMWCRRTARLHHCGSGWRRSSRRICPTWMCWTSPGSLTAWGKGDLLLWSPGTSLRFVRVMRHTDTCRLYWDEGLALDGTPNQTRRSDVHQHYFGQLSHSYCNSSTCICVCCPPCICDVKPMTGSSNRNF